jgi:hypothetical protein
VDRLLVPLLGAGVAGLSPGESLGAICRAAVEAPAATGLDRRITVVIFDESALGLDEVRATVKACTVVDDGNVSP